MDKSSKLIPSDIKLQCDAAISALQDNNDALIKTLFSVDTFMMDTSIQSDAFDVMRNQISNYNNIINMIRSANLADIDDYNTLKTMVGEEELDGDKLLTMLEELKRQRATTMANLSDVKALANSNADTSTLEHAKKQSHNYEKMLEFDDDMIRKIQEKIDFYDKVDSQSAALFKTGGEIRSAALAMIEEISKSTVKGGTYVTPSAVDMANHIAGLSTSAQLFLNGNKYVRGNFNSLVPNHDASIMTQNLRAEQSKDTENNTCDARAPRVFCQIKKYDTDIVCFQECNKQWKGKLGEMFNPREYDCVYGYNSKGLCNPIYIKKSKFELIESDTMVISGEYTLDGKRQESRVASWAKIKDKETGKTMVIMNTHYDAKSKQNQVSSSQLLKNKVAELNPDNYIITGDFNMDASNNKKAYDIMVNGSKNMAEASRIEGIQGRFEGTYHNFGAIPVQDRKQIDYFFGSDSLNSDFFSVVNDTYNNEVVSDHNGIVNYFSYK